MEGWRLEDVAEKICARNNGKLRRGEDRENVIMWVQREPPRPPVQSHFVVKSLAGGLSPTWLSENNRLLL